MQTKIVNFLSAKGGVGKSVIAANFAEILSEQGYRTAIIEAPNLNNQEIILNALQRKRISLPSAVAVKISQNLTLVSPALVSQNPVPSQNFTNNTNSMAQNSIKNASSNADNYVVQSSQDDESGGSHNYAQKFTSSDGKNNSENSAAANSMAKTITAHAQRRIWRGRKCCRFAPKYWQACPRRANLRNSSTAG